MSAAAAQAKDVVCPRPKEIACPGGQSIRHLVPPLAILDTRTQPTSIRARSTPATNAYNQPAAMSAVPPTRPEVTSKTAPDQLRVTPTIPEGNVQNYGTAHPVGSSMA